jgi:hypothetical protein
MRVFSSELRRIAARSSPLSHATVCVIDRCDAAGIESNAWSSMSRRAIRQHRVSCGSCHRREYREEPT